MSKGLYMQARGVFIMNYTHLLGQIERAQTTAQSAVARSANQFLTMRNWLIGAWIIEFEQNGEDRATYGENLLERIADDLRSRGLVGLSGRNLWNCRQFTLAYPDLQILQTASAEFIAVDTLTGQFEQNAKSAATNFPSLAARHEASNPLEWQDSAYYSRLFATLSWSHLLELTRIDDPLKRAFYELEAVKSGWSMRELKRQIASMLYERTGLSRDKDAVLALADHGRLIDSAATMLRDPYILEFLGLAERPHYSESDLEAALITHLKEFLLELGRDFCFVSQQFRITVANRHHHLDLLFYHRGLRCLVAIDLKLGAFRHEDAGQMNFYLNYLRENEARAEENPPVGILLCADKDSEEVHYATAGMDQNLFVSRYLVALPSEDRLKQWLHEEQQHLTQSTISDDDGDHSA
jgi:predicted nuclease of restriction endonuclease-like (RecB) superfamily